MDAHERSAAASNGSLSLVIRSLGSQATVFAPTNDAISAFMTERPELAAYQTRADLAEVLAAYHGVIDVRICHLGGESATAKCATAVQSRADCAVASGIWLPTSNGTTAVMQSLVVQNNITAGWVRNLTIYCAPNW